MYFGDLSDEIQNGLFVQFMEAISVFWLPGGWIQSLSE
jgi:hypothetical protein